MEGYIVPTVGNKKVLNDAGIENQMDDYSRVEVGWGFKWGGFGLNPKP